MLATNDHNNEPKQTFWQNLINLWPVFVTLGGIAFATYIQLNLLEYRVTKIEETIVDVKKDIKESLTSINDTVKVLQLDMRELVSVTRSQHNNLK